MMRRRRRTATCVSVAAVFSCLLASSGVANAGGSTSTSTTPSALGHDRDWWLDRVLLAEDFRFDGSHADFAQQFFRLFVDGTAPATDAIASGQLDKPQADAVAARIDQAVASSSTSDRDALSPRAVAFDGLSPLLQRAVLWDLGIVKAGDVAYTQVWTQCGLRMNELAVSKATYEAVGCTAQACSTSNGQTYYQSLFCNGFQMGNASRCAAASGKSPVHASMWSNGGDEWTLPDSIVAKHEWTDTNTSFVIYGIHLADDPNSYGKCVSPSMTVPCIAYERLSDDELAAWCKPAPSRLVTQWIRAENDLAAVRTAAAKKTPPLEIVLSSIFAAVVLLVGVWWIVKRRRERRRARARTDDQSSRGNAKEPTEQDEDGAAVSYFFTEDTIGGAHKRRGMGYDPHAMPVLEGGFTSFDKAPSFRREASFVGSRRRREDNASFGQVPRDSTGLAHGEMITGCGAVLAGSSTYGDSGSRHSGDQKASVKGEPAVFPLRRESSPVCPSDSSTYVSTNSDSTTEPFRRSTMPLHETCTTSGDTYTLSSSSSGSSATLSPQDDSDVLSDLLQDSRVMDKRVPYVDISVSRQLSKGAFGEVWVGRMRDKLVAVKRLVPERRHKIKDIDTFIAEIRLMALFEHRNVMSLLGVAWNSPRNLCMMMEFLDNGDLMDLLKARPPDELTWRRHDADKSHTADGAVDAGGKKASIAIDVASALQYLHGMSPPVVHRDLKSHNILLTVELVAKLCDFGVSRVNEGIDTMTCGVGTAYWTAPEVLVGDKYTETADVYSFGVVLTELDTHQLPFHNAVDDAGQRIEAIRAMHLVCMGELAPSVSPDCPTPIRELARDCMELEPASRPTLDEIIRRLRRFITEDGCDDDPFLNERATMVSAETASVDDPSSRRRTRLSSSFSIFDDGQQETSIGGDQSRLSNRRQVNDSFDDGNDSDGSTRESGHSDSEAVWI